MYYLQHPYHSKKGPRTTTVPGSSGDMTVSQVTENGALNNKMKNVLEFSTSRKGKLLHFYWPLVRTAAGERTHHHRTSPTLHQCQQGEGVPTPLVRRHSHEHSAAGN